MDLRQLQRNPAEFRNSLRVRTDVGLRRFGAVMDAWQREDFCRLDEVFVGGGRAWVERPRGHSKTLDVAVMAAWRLFASSDAVHGIAAAADRDQAGLLRDALAGLVRANEWLGEFLEVDSWKVSNPHTGSRLDILSSDVGSSYGVTPDFVVCDEVTHWIDRELFDSLLSSAAKRRDCCFLAITNAGFRDSWQWQVREAVRRDPGWTFLRLDGPQASWLTQDRLAEQQRLLPHIAYRRLWLNEWTSGSGDALDSAAIEAACTLPGPVMRSEPGWYFVAGVDLGLSRDASAVVVVARDVGHYKPTAEPARLNRTQEILIEAGVIDAPAAEPEDAWIPGSGKLVVADVLLWRPSPGRKVALDEVERALVELHQRYTLQAVACDPWQAAYLIQRLQQHGIPAEPTDFTPANLKAMCSATLEAFSERQLSMFRHEQLLSDLRSLRVEERSYGVRLVSPRGPQGHGDAAAALQVALLAAQRLDRHVPVRVEGELLCA